MVGSGLTYGWVRKVAGQGLGSREHRTTARERGLEEMGTGSSDTEATSQVLEQ